MPEPNEQLVLASSIEGPLRRRINEALVDPNPINGVLPDLIDEALPAVIDEALLKEAMSALLLSGLTNSQFSRQYYESQFYDCRSQACPLLASVNQLP